MSFKDTLDALDAEEKAMALTAERYEETREEWKEIEARYASLRADLSDSDGDALARVADFIRRRGPAAAKYLGIPGAAVTATAVGMAEEGTFIGPSGILSIFGQALGW